MDILVAYCQPSWSIETHDWDIGTVWQQLHHLWQYARVGRRSSVGFGDHGPYRLEVRLFVSAELGTLV
jgi:hypothetical protein